MPDHHDILHTAAADMRRVAETSGETAVLARFDGDAALVVDVAGSAPIARAGARLPLLGNPLGEALGATLPPDRRAALADSTGAAAQDGREATLARLAFVAARGYAIAAGGPETAGVAAPVPGADGVAVAAIGLVGPPGMLPRARLHDLAPAVVEATRAATAMAGGSLRPLSQTPRPAEPAAGGVEALAAARCIIGEGPVVEAATGRLWWVDMYDPAICRLDPGSGAPAIFHPGEMVAALAPAPEGLFAAAQSGLWLLDPETCARRRFLGDPEAGLPARRFNDMKRDPAGRLWANTIDYAFAAGAGALYRWTGADGFVAMDAGLDVPNGMDWSPDGRTMYVADTGRRTILAYDVDDGAVSGRRVFACVPDDVPGAPDGLTVDDDGNVLVALFDGWRIARFAPSGDFRGSIVLPVPRPTSCALADSGRTLIVTSARIRVPAATLASAPLSGALLRVPL